MRNLKRVLGLALASVMVLSMMVIGAGAANYDDFTDKDEIVNTEAVQMLVELGVLQGKDTGAFDPTGIITRGEMAKMICVVLNGGKDPSLGATVNSTYTDTVGHWASGYIEYCSQLGIVAGKGDGTFDPNGTVTGSEAAKMLLVALGYKSEIEGFTGSNWAVGVNVRANQKGLYDDLDISVDAGLSRDNAAQMIYNALDANMVEYTYSLYADEDSSLTSSPTLQDKVNNDGYEVTLLEDRFNAVKVEGIVVANEYANLSGSNHLNDERTRVMITNFDDQGYYGKENDDTATVDFAVTTGLDELGRKVFFYVEKEATSTNADVLGSVILSDENTVIADYSKDSFTDIADDNNLDLRTSEGDNDDEEITLVAQNYGNSDELTETTAGATNIRGQEKLFIDNDDDGEVEYIIVNAWRFGKVTSYVTSGSGSIAINQGSAPTLTESDADDVIGFEDVARDDYVIAAEIGGRTFVEKAETITGELEANNTGSTMTEEGKIDDNVVTKLSVDGEDYSVSSMLGYTGGSDDIQAGNEYDDTYLDNEVTFCLGKGGYIVAGGESEASAYDYALVLATGTTGLEDRVRVALSDGTTGTYDVDDDSEVDQDNAEVGTVYRYSINSSDEIKLTKVSAPDDLDSAQFEKGRTSIKDVSTTEAVATSSTAFFYVDGVADLDAVTSIDEDNVDVYTGYDRAPDLEESGVKGQVYLRSGDNAGAVVFYAKDGLTSADMDDSLYVTEIIRKTSDYTDVYAYVAGSDELQEIKVDGRDVTDGQAYTFEINSDGYYELDSLTVGDDGVDGSSDVASDSSSTFVLDRNDAEGNNEYEITSDTLLVDYSDYLDDSTGELGAGPSEDDHISWVTYNSDDEAIMVVIWNPEVDDGAEETTDADSVVSAGSGSNIGTVADVLGAESVNEKLAEDLKAGMSDVMVVPLVILWPHPSSF